MEKKLDLNQRLDFSDIDLTAPDKVVEEILSQLPEETQGIVLGKIVKYDGEVESYTKKGFSAISIGLGSTDEKIDIQTQLGKIGAGISKFECYLYTPEYKHYKYRMFFMKYGIANYPVNIILEQNLAKSATTDSYQYKYTCNNRNELEDLIINVLASKKSIEVMQELIRIHQANKKTDISTESESDVSEE